MLLTIDIGNTSTVLAFFENNELKHQWRIPSEINRQKAQLKAELESLSLQNQIILGGLGTVFISSVVPQLNPVYSDILSQFTGTQVHVISHQDFKELDIQVDYPDQVGTDRLLNAFAAYKIYGEDCIIADCGTATNIEVVTN